VGFSVGLCSLEPEKLQQEVLREPNEKYFIKMDSLTFEILSSVLARFCLIFTKVLHAPAGVFCWKRLSSFQIAPNFLLLQ